MDNKRKNEKRRRRDQQNKTLLSVPFNAINKVKML